jgi:hypothetical protein
MLLRETFQNEHTTKTNFDEELNKEQSKTENKQFKGTAFGQRESSIWTEKCLLDLFEGPLEMGLCTQSGTFPGQHAEHPISKRLYRV